jgi:acetylornithine deacetylase/succinyl-diaminopimelate desuccinylase-like protein
MTDVQSYIDHHIDTFQKQLFDLLRIPSISTSSDYKTDVLKAASFLQQELDTIGMDHVQLYETEGHPIVYAEKCPHENRPIVLIYGHYDVQPPDPVELWLTPPFEPTVKNNRVYARGASDDKGQSFTHIKSIESYLETGTELPVNVKFLFEGEEEIGSPNLIPFITDHKEMLKCDMVLISDTAMFGENQPSITYGLRGLTYMEIEVKGPNRDLHSGVYGGTVENPANALSSIIARKKMKMVLFRSKGSMMMLYLLHKMTGKLIHNCHLMKRHMFRNWISKKYMEKKGFQHLRELQLAQLSMSMVFGADTRVKEPKPYYQPKQEQKSV